MIQYNTFIHLHSPRPLSISSLHSCSVEKNLPVVPSRESNSGLPSSKPTRYQLSHAAPYWATPHHTEPRRTMLSHAAPYWATPHHGNKFIAGVIDANEQLVTGVVDTGDKYSFANISANFEKFEKAPLVYFGARETLIHTKTWSWKSCVRPPLIPDP